MDIGSTRTSNERQGSSGQKVVLPAGRSSASLTSEESDREALD